MTASLVIPHSDSRFCSLEIESAIDSIISSTSIYVKSQTSFSFTIPVRRIKESLSLSIDLAALHISIDVLTRMLLHFVLFNISQSTLRYSWKNCGHYVYSSKNKAR